MRRAVLVVSAVAALAMSALAVPGGAAPAGGGGPKCPLKALDNADTPVEITFWHSMTRASEEELIRLTDEFHSSQDTVRVNLVNQTGYEDTLEKYRAGLGGTDLPDIVQIDFADLQQMIDTQSVLPAQACVDADDYDLSDHVDRIIGAFTVEDTLWPMPFNSNTPVLYYNKNAFRQAGLDPEQPPTTLTQVREYSEALKASGFPTGVALKIDAFFLEQYLGKADRLYVNNGNGRKERASEAVFDEKAGRQLATWMAGMVNDDLAITTPRTGPGQIDHFLALANKQAAITVDTSGALGTIAQVLDSGEFADVELGVGPFPGPNKGGVLVGGAALFMVSESAPAKQAAAWEFAKFLNEPEQAAEWAAATGFIPIRKSAVDLPVVNEQWAEEPGFRVAYDQLLAGKNDLATAGAVIGDVRGVRAAIEDELTRMLTQGKNPRSALKDAQAEADSAIEEYNTRVGG